MPFQRAHEKWGGRRPGTPNKNSFGTVRERLAELDCDPVAELVSIARDPSTSPELKSRILLGILAHVAPKLRAIDQSLSAPDGAEPVRIEIIRVGAPAET